MKVEMEGLIRLDPAAIEMRGAEEKWAWCVGEATGAILELWFEDGGIGALAGEGAGGRGGAIWGASDGTEASAETATQDVRRFARRKVDGLGGGEVETKRAQLQGRHVPHSTLLWGEDGLTEADGGLQRAVFGCRFWARRADFASYHPRSYIVFRKDLHAVAG